MAALYPSRNAASYTTLWAPFSKCQYSRSAISVRRVPTKTFFTKNRKRSADTFIFSFVICVVENAAPVQLMN